jgi:hypothetical protein
VAKNSTFSRRVAPPSGERSASQWNEFEAISVKRQQHGAPAAQDFASARLVLTVQSRSRGSAALRILRGTRQTVLADEIVDDYASAR